MSPDAQKIWLDGQILPASTPVFAASERGLTLGDGLFETIRMAAGQPCFMDDHWRRLSASAKVFCIPLPFGPEAILAGLEDLARLNQVKTGAARIMLTRGSGPRGLALPPEQKPHMLITMAPGLPACPAPPVLGLSTVQRHRHAPSCAHKTLSYMDNIAARLHQCSHERRNDVVMLDSDSQLACASAANLFWWHGGVLHTPALNGAILPGTMRARVLALARNEGFRVAEGSFSANALLEARAAFLTNALIGVQVMAGVDFGKLGQAVFDQEHGDTRRLRVAVQKFKDR